MPLTPEVWLNEFTVNTVTSGVQLDPDITQLANGNILVSWASTDNTGAGSPSGLDIIGQLYNSRGEAIGGEFRLNQSVSADNESAGRITALPGGGFSMVYIDNDGNGGDIEVATFDAAGVEQSRSTVALGSTGLPDFRSPTITAISDTQALIAYVEDNASGDDRILVRTYDPSTNTLGAVVEAFGDPGNNGDGNIINLEIDVLGNGNYIIGGTVEGSNNIVFSVVSPGGIAVPGNVFGNGTTQDASFAGLSGNVFVYAEQVQNGGDSFITVLRIDTGTNTLLGFTDINPPGNQNYNEPEVVALDDGGFIVFWDDDDANTLEGQRFDASGNTVGNQFQLTDTPNAIQIEATLLADGRVAVSFVASPTAFASNIFQVIIDTRDNANTAPVYSPDSQQIGTIGDDTFQADAAEAFGYDGNDTITDGAGANDIFGGNGNDTITLLGVDSSESADGGADTDTLIVTNTGANDLTIDLAAGTLTNFGITQSTVNFENITSGDGNDTITGTAGDNVINGGDGIDTITGGNGADTINGGDGNDIIVAGGADLADGIDTVFGGEGDDTITGGFFVDDLHGDAGDDTFIIGYDQVQGLADFIDTIDGGADNDTLDLSAVLSGVGGYTVDLQNEVYEASAGGGAGQQSITNVENIIGSQGNDTLTGDGEVNDISGGDGIDRIDGGAGADILTGGAGNDTYIIDNIGDVVTEGMGDASDQVFTLVDYDVPENVELLTMGGTGDLRSNGTDARDIIIGNSGNNTINGGGDGGLGDVMQGGDGNDSYAVDNSNDAVVETATGGNDAIDSLVDFNLAQSQNVETLILRRGSDTAVQAFGDDTDNQLFGNEFVNNLFGAGGTDFLLGFEGSDNFIITPENGAVDVIGDWDFMGDKDRIGIAGFGDNAQVVQVSTTSFEIRSADGSITQQFILQGYTGGGLVEGTDYFFG